MLKIFSKNKQRVEQITRSTQKMVHFSACTDVGIVREINQDNMFLMRPVLTSDRLLHYEADGWVAVPAIFAICDGMGGGRHGEDASYLAACMIEKVDVKRISQKSDEQLEQYLRALCCQMNDAIYEQYGHMGVLVGCTVVLIYVDEQRCYFVNVGDSLGMCLSGQQDLQIMTQSDNRANQLYLLGQIAEKDRWTHQTKNQLTQYLGMDPEEVQISPHICRLNYVEDDMAYLLCSDGLLDHNSFERLSTQLSHGSMDTLASDCVKGAMSVGSRDNVTAIVMKVETVEG